MSKNQKHSNYLHKVSVSQNFLTSKKLLGRIVNLSNINKPDTVIEIGTGKGHLTRTLCQKCGFLYSIEIDQKLTTAMNPPQDIWLIVEKGAAKRFTGKSGETAQSLSLKTAWETEILYHFRRSDFHPMPSDDSVLLHLTRKKHP